MDDVKVVKLGVAGCRRCKSKAMRVEYIQLSPPGGLGFNHVDLYCFMCGEFIGHLDLKPHG
jgi:hypothetical protein